MSRITRTSEEEIALGERKNGGGLACDEVSVDAYFVSFGINGDVGSAGIVDEIFFPDIAAVFNRNGGFLQPKPFVETSGKSRFRKKCDARGGGGIAEGAKHRPIENRLRSGNRGARVAHRIPGNKTALDDHLGFYAEECRLPENEVGKLARFDGSDFAGYAVGDGGIDGVLRDVALCAVIVITGGIFRERAALRFHFVRGLPGANDDFADAAHGLRIARKHADDAQIMEDVLGGDGFGANAAFGESDIFGDVGIQMVANHEHVEMFGDCVNREGTRGIRR